jgi:catechol 2,3-dioxygenase-like lactoylglutathione lyase family enzyme
MMLVMVISLVMSMGVLIACGDDDDDDDDDDAGSAVYQACIDFYTDCGLEEDAVNKNCDVISGVTDDCLNAAYTDFFVCLDGVGDCSDAEGTAECGTEFADAGSDCV